uniref:Uncharacterized protein n=1 Tax=Anguilla anguilla TaxID=7936 RepID=A0A0E9SP95_ANGAN
MRMSADISIVLNRYTASAHCSLDCNKGVMLCIFLKYLYLNYFL